MRFGQHKKRRTTIIILMMCVFLMTLGAVRLRPTSMLIMLILIISIVVGLVLSRNYPAQIKLVITSGFIFASMLAIWQGNRYINMLADYRDLYGSSVVLDVIAREDAVYSDRKQLVFTANNITNFQSKQKLVGNIEVEGFGASMVYRGDVVRVEGKLFPKRGDNVAGISFARITTISASSSRIDDLRREFAAGLQNVLPEPHASLALGLLIGQRNSLPETFNQQLITVGLIHIVAVSGYNVTIIINASKRLLAKRSRYQALIGSMALIGIFLLLTGSSPSIVRAAIVSIIGLIGWYYGRSVKPLVLLLLAATITAGLNPLYLWSSIGWYLSFTAFFGVLVLAPLFQRSLLPRRKLRVPAQILTETFCAQLCTLPILFFIFGRLSIISIVANVLVVPLVPFAMLGSLLAGIMGMIGQQFLSSVFVWPARLILEYIVSATNVLSRVPNATIDAKANAAQMIILYVVIVFVSLLLWKKQSKTAIITKN